MRPTHLLPLLCGVFASAVGALAACGTEEPTPTPGPDPVAPVDAGPATREAPSHLSASTNLADLVRLTWSPPVNRAGLSGYRLFRDGKVLALVPASETSFDDRTAVAATLLPPLLTASDGTRETGIEVSWKPVGTGGVIALQSYAVVAMYGAEESVPSLPAQGSRAGIVTGYEVSQDGGPWTPVPKGELRFEDTNAPRAKVTFPIPQVEDDFKRSAVRLELPTHPVVGLMPPRTYRVRAVSATAKGDPSLPATGKRKTGLGDRIPLQWQRSATPADGSYADIPGVTGRVWIDANAPASEARFFRARVDAPWAEGVSSARAARATAWSAIGVSNTHACALDLADGKLRCWGDNSLGQAPPGPSADSYVGLTVSPSYTCAIRASDRHAVCFGGYFGVQAAPPDALLTLSSYGTRVCGLRASDSSIVCWGTDIPGLTPFDASQSYDRLAVYYDGLCAIRKSDHRVKCWGGSWAVPDEAFVRVAVGLAGPSVVCGIREVDGKLRCWGTDLEGSGFPGLAAPTLDSYSELEAGAGFVCAIRSSDRQLRCWAYQGSNYYNQAITHTPTGRFKSVAMSAYNSAAALREDGRVVSWGDLLTAESGALVEDEFSTIALGDEHGCGIRASDGKLSCWPYGSEGVGGSDSYKALAISSGTCALRASDGRPFCSPYFGTVSVTDPLDSISMAGHRACGVRSSDKRVVCWDGEFSIHGPIPPLPSDAFLSVTTSSFHGCGIRASDKRVVCWGSNYNGEAPPGPSTAAFKQVVANAGGTCGLRAADSVIECWGADAPNMFPFDGASYKSLGGDGCAIRAADDRVVCVNRFLSHPVLPPYKNVEVGIDPVTELASFNTRYRVCGTRVSDRKLICWGFNLKGHQPRP